MNRDALKLQLAEHEGVRKYPYEDTVGKVTVGIGRNLTDRGLRPKEIEFLLDNDIDEVLAEITRAAPWVFDLTENRQLALANMVFNLGITKFLDFKRTINCIKRGQYDWAATHMLESKWARQVGDKPGQRAFVLADLMRRG